MVELKFCLLHSEPKNWRIQHLNCWPHKYFGVIEADWRWNYAHLLLFKYQRKKWCFWRRLEVNGRMKSPIRKVSLLFTFPKQTNQRYRFMKLLCILFGKYCHKQLMENSGNDFQKRFWKFPEFKDLLGWLQIEKFYFKNPWKKSLLYEQHIDVFLYEWGKNA